MFYYVIFSKCCYTRKVYVLYTLIYYILLALHVPLTSVSFRKIANCAAGTYMYCI